MTEREIIEILLLELDVLVTCLESEEANYSRPDGTRLLDDSRDYIQALKRAGYKFYPEYEYQTKEQKEEIIELSNRLKKLKENANGQDK